MIIFATVFGKTAAMKFFSTSQIRSIDKHTIAMEPISSVDLMERAAEGLFRWIVARHSAANSFIIFAGNGNNGGDGVALARMLILAGYNVNLCVLKSDSPYSPDLQSNLTRIVSQGIIDINYISQISDLPEIKPSSVVVDALFGSGLSRPVSGFAADVVKHVNKSAAHVIAIDIPSGLFGEENPVPNPNPVIRAKTTLTLHFPKLSFFFADNKQFVGNWKVIPIGLHPVAIGKTPTQFNYLTHNDISSIIRVRNTHDHKGTFGHVLLIAGSYGMMGASVLASKACIAGGCGLVTAHIPRLGYSILQHSVPEVLVAVDDNDWYFTGAAITSKYKAVGIGPGIGTETKTIAGFKELLKRITVPLVVDADGLNIIAQYPELLNLIPKNTVITPHPGEFDRLFGDSVSSYHRFDIAMSMAKKFNIIIVLKGAFSQIFSPSGEVFFNSTGNPGMATAGSGDVLTGLITSLLGQGYEPYTAAKLGVYIHGLAGDFACEQVGQSALTASDIITNLGKAFSSFNV